MVFEKKELQKMAYGESERLEVVEKAISDSSRWSICYSVVFKDNETGKHYASYYSVGATECQDESPYEYDNDEIECEEVELKEVLVKQWVAV